MEQENVNWGISGSSLKLIALFSMLIDHTAAVLYPALSMVGIESTGMLDLYWVMRTIGRMAFPIYCFLLVEGYNHTSDKLKYAMRLFLFAIISEVPFDLALNNVSFELASNNVFFTLFIGFLVLVVIDWINDVNKVNKSQSTVVWFAMTFMKCAVIMASIAMGMIIAEFVLKTDYGAAGVGCIVTIYLMQSFREISFMLGVALLGLLISPIEFWALFMVIPISCYNGKKGISLKYFFYAFYPVHLLILFGISQFIISVH